MNSSLQFSVFSWGKFSVFNGNSPKLKTENCFSEESFMSYMTTPRNNENIGSVLGAHASPRAGFREWPAAM